MASAEAFAKRPGVIIDLLEELTVNVTQTKTFRGDTTYVVSGQITCSAPVTIEGGAVFKYPSSPTAFIKLNNTLSCKTSSYHPAIFTAIDDDTVGDWAPGSSGSTIDPNTQQQIYYANPALHLYYLYSPSLSNLRFSHCREAVRIEANVDTSSATVSHSQFVNCVKGIVITGSGSGDGTATPLTVNNSLLAHVDYPLTVNVNAAESFIYHCTIDNSVQLITATGYSSFTFVNSVLANVTTLKSGPTSVSGNYNGFYNVTTSSQFGSNLKVLGPDDPSPFVPTTIVDPFGFDVPSPTTGEGGYYLTGSCPFKDAGTTTIPATLKADLSLRTTDPPIYFSEILYSDYTLREAVQRDVDIPNLGYHYDVVDYAVFRSSVFGCNLLVEPGVVCGFIFSDSTHGIQQYGYGLRIGSNARLVAEGTPSSPIVFARLSLVQENPLMGLQGHFQPILTTQPILEEARSLDPEYPIIQLRFVDFPAGPIDSILEPGYSWEQEFWTGDGGDWASWTYFTSISISDCQFRGGWIRLNSGADVARTIAIKNTLFERCSFFAGDLPPEYEWWVSSPEIGEQFSIYNCLFYGGHLQLIPVSAAPWKIRDNIFDQVTLFQNDTDPVLYHDHNAYIGMGGSRIKPAPDAAHDTDVLLTSLTYSTSTLGRFYLPSTASALFGAGSRPKVESGLGHYTSRTSQLRELDESAGNVNIGLHYVALLNQLPRDTDQDGLADYIEDTDGDGILDAGESNTATALADGCFPFGLATLPGSEWQGYVTLYADSKYSDWSLDQLTFFADGEPVPAQQTANLAGSRRIVVIDSRRLPNGSHGIQCRADFSTSNQQDPDGEPQQEILNSTPFTVTVNNVLAIPTWDREFGYDKFGMNGSVIGNPTGVEVRVYQMPQDVNAVPIWVRTLTAPVINGSIDLTWNMTDENGNPLYFDDEQQILFAAVKPTGGQGGTGGASSAGSKVRVMPDFPAKGMWLAAYQYVLTYFYNRETSLEAQGAHAIMAGIQGGIEGQSENNGGYFRPDIDPLFRDAQRYQYLWQPIPQITDWMRHKSVSEEAAANYVGDAWSLLLKCLGGSNKDIAQQTYLVRNFYFFGHHGKRIGGETYKGVGFTPQDLKMEREKNKKGPFRWAWIDGCSTEGKWAEAFGVSTKFRTKYTQSEIDKAEDPNERDQMLNHFLNIGLVPNAYMGWNQSKRFADSLNVGNLMANDLGGYRRDLISNFVGFGTTPKSIHLAIQLATQNNTTGVASWFAVEDGMVVYGFKYLKGDRFNDFSEIENFLKNGVKPPGY